MKTGQAGSSFSPAWMSDVGKYGIAIAAHARLREWQDGLNLMLELSQRGVQANSVIYNTCINACSHLVWQQGIGILRRMKPRFLETDVISFSAGMNCGRVDNWPSSMYLLEMMRANQIQSNAISYSTASTCCAPGNRWQLSMLVEMQLRQIQSNTITYNSAMMVYEQTAWWYALQEFTELQMASLEVNSRTLGVISSALEKSTQWQCAIAVLLAKTEMPGNVQLLTTAISACEQGDQWEKAICLLQQFQRVTRVDIVAYNNAISACAKSGKWQISVCLLEQLADFGLKEDDVTFNAVMNSFAQGSQWEWALAFLQHLHRGRAATDTITFASAMFACNKSSQWRAAMRLLEVPNERLETNEIVYNMAIHACKLGQQWFLALNMLESMSQNMILPSIVSWDSAMLACLGCRDDLALEILLESAPVRDPISFLWSLASIGVSDAEVIYDASRNAVDYLSHSGSATELARCWWAAATLGIRSDILTSAVNRVMMSTLKLEDLSMALTGLAGMSPYYNLSFMLDAQTSVEHILRSSLGDARRFLFNREGKDLLAILFSCSLAGCLSSRLQGISQVMRNVGKSLDEQNEDMNLILSADGDRCVLLKPAGWEVYGGHVEQQLVNFVARNMPSKICRDSDHNFGFLHRLDVPSSGLILVAKNYEAFYDLQVQLHSGDIAREYSALCHGSLPTSIKEIRASTQIQNDMPTRSGGRGKFSQTSLKSSRSLYLAANMFSFLLITILTGRKHQIRSQLMHIGHPTVRDKIYTSREVFLSDGDLCSRNWLHRHRITFTDGKGTHCEACCDLPADLNAVFTRAVWCHNSFSL